MGSRQPMEHGAIFSLTMPVPPKEKQEEFEREFLRFAKQGPAIDPKIIKQPHQWTLHAEFDDPTAFASFALCFPGGKEALANELARKAAKAGKQ